jgi:hypothetical protein
MPVRIPAGALPRRLAGIPAHPATRNDDSIGLFTLGAFVDYVGNLTTPCIIGMVSVSGPGLKTMDGVFAESIGKQHRLILFLLEWPVAKIARL